MVPSSMSRPLLETFRYVPGSSNGPAENDITPVSQTQSARARFLVATSHDDRHEAADAFKGKLQTFTSDQVALPGTEAYSRLNYEYLSIRQREHTPAAIFEPNSAEDIAQFLRIIKANKAKFAIRGVEFKPDEGIVSVGAGVTWGPAYEKVQAVGLSVGGSRSVKGGIGGLALFGGLFFFFTREGFICDNVVNFQVVLASDLWRALKGGGNNFGVVTRFDLRTCPQGSFWGGFILYAVTGDNYSRQVEAMSKQFGGIMMGLNEIYYTGPDAASVYGSKGETTGKARVPPMLEPFTTVENQVGSLNSLRIMTLVEGATEHAMASQEHVCCAYMNCTVRADKNTLLAAAEIYSKAIEHLKPVEGITLCLTLDGYPNSVLRKTEELGGNVLGLNAGDSLISVLLLTYWKNKEGDENIILVLQKALGDIEKDAERRGQIVPYVYLNYTSSFQDPFTLYGEENKRFLQEVSRRYDPYGLFQNSFPGEFKLLA
ncbi:Bifunctional solanapyrone synthase [Daldinia childiae]|uniref:Bifunctional solanapyrone synthase n=1 Tax=Daldinia childiae TaxID=326645 RepID=UPI001447BED2|nr:Bifunctional solanapyrone synthase [Daldinia childiae]KAF3055857.1 Bifunctional solanapyrone synthase [Daldinia childiae]